MPKKKITKSKSKSRKNTGTDYELLVRDIYQSILRLHGDDFKNITVQHNVHLDSVATKSKDGKPLKRQIDVYWEFIIAGITHRVCVQAKDFLTNKISLPMVDTFSSVLSDLSGPPRGVMVTRKGFQSGAEAYARQKGIELMLLTPVDEQSSPSRINLSFQSTSSRILSTGFSLDEVWMSEQKIFQVSFFINNTAGEVFFYKEDGTVLMSFADATEQSIPQDRSTPGIKTGELVFHEPTYLSTGDPKVPRVKVHSFRTTIETILALPPTKIKRYVSHLFKSATASESFWVDDSGSVRKAGERISLTQEFEIDIGNGKKARLRVEARDDELTQSTEPYNTMKM